MNTFRLTNVITERIIFVSRGITVLIKVLIFLAHKNVEFTCTEQRPPDDRCSQVRAEMRARSVELAPFHPSGSQNLEVATRFLENLLTTGRMF